MKKSVNKTQIQPTTCNLNFEEIPDFNDLQYEGLVLSLLKGTCCIFYGAGISKFAGYKLWAELKDVLIDYVWEQKNSLPSTNIKSMNLDYSMCENLKKYDDILEIFEFLYRQEREFFIDGVKHIFACDKKNSNNEIFLFLKKFKTKGNIFITTNIDNGFQEYLGLNDDQVSVYPDFNNPPKIITYLHGRIDKEGSWILTKSQYNKAYAKKPICEEYLKKISENHTILFIGYGLSEKEIQRALCLSNKSKVHYWIEEYSRNKIDHLKIRSTNLRGEYNIRTIPYCIDNRSRFEMVCKVVDSLYSKMIEKGRNIR